MLRFQSNFINGVQHLLFFRGLRQLALYSTVVNDNFVNYLVENLGFSNQQAVSTFSKFNLSRQARGVKEVSDFDLVNNASSVVTFLKKIGLQQSHIRYVIDTNPRILMCNVDKTLIPKTEFFQKLGFSETDIVDIIRFNSSIYFVGLNTSIVPAIQALREIIGCQGNDVVSVLKKLRCYNLVSIHKCLVPNVAFLRSYGVPLGLIRKFLLSKPFFLLRNTDYFQNALITVESKFGIPRNSPQFLAGSHIVCCLNEKTIESKMQVYKSFGWTDSDIATLVSSNPCILGFSEEGIKKKLDFLMNELGYKASYLASHCVLFTCSLEKRVVPRHKVLVALKENGLIRKDYALPTALVCTESKFLQRFVLPFKEVHELYSKHAGISLEMLTLGSPEPNSVVV